MGEVTKEQTEEVQKQDGNNVEKAIDAVKQFIEKRENIADDAFDNAANELNDLEVSIKESFENINSQNVARARIDSYSH